MVWMLEILIFGCKSEKNMREIKKISRVIGSISGEMEFISREMESVSRDFAVLPLKRRSSSLV
jgi:hypothetical protein